MYNLHYENFRDGTVKCIEDEIPFEVPEGWEWCRLEAINADIQDGNVNWNTVPFTTVSESSRNNHLVQSPY